MQKLIGIVACGGTSSRMGVDKSTLKYYATEQKYHVYNLLKPICSEVYLACNKSQAQKNIAGYAYIIDDDACENIGPMACLVSANAKIKDAAFLVVGCDYPQLQSEDLAKLANARNEAYNAVCYKNTLTNFDEPLLAIYEQSAMPFLYENFNKQEFSLRHLLSQIRTRKIEPNSLENIISADTPEAFNLILQKIRNINEQ